MHVLGKVCIWLMIPLVIAGVVLAGQAINVRNSWTQQADTLSEDNQKLAREIAEKEARLNDLRNERSLLQRSWGNVWISDNVVVNDVNQGTISIQKGTRDGLKLVGEDEMPVLYGFYTPDNGQGRYIGSFKVVDMRDNSSTLQMTKLPRPDDVATWQQGPWRFWEYIPTQYANRHDSLWNTLISTEEHLSHVEKLKRQATEQNERAKEQIQVRLAELEGGDEIPMGVSGLVSSLQQEEQERDEQLLAVDQLRRQIHGAQTRLQELLEESRRLMQQLPKPYLDTASRPEPVSQN